MPQYAVVVEVRKLYTVFVDAPSVDDARDIAENMQLTEIYKEGNLGDIETVSVAVELEPPVQ